MNKENFLIYIYNLLLSAREREHRKISLSLVTKSYNDNFIIAARSREYEDILYYHHLFSDLLKIYEFLERNSALTPENLYYLLKDTLVYPYRISKYPANYHSEIHHLLRDLSNRRTDLKGIGFLKDDLDKPYSSLNNKTVGEVVRLYKLGEFFSKKK